MSHKKSKAGRWVYEYYNGYTTSLWVTNYNEYVRLYSVVLRLTTNEKSQRVRLMRSHDAAQRYFYDDSDGNKKG